MANELPKLNSRRDPELKKIQGEIGEIKNLLQTLLLEKSKEPEQPEEKVEIPPFDRDTLLRQIHEDRDRRLTLRLERLREMDNRISAIFNSTDISTESEPESKVEIKKEPESRVEIKKKESPPIASTEKREIKPQPKIKEKKRWRR